MRCKICKSMLEFRITHPDFGDKYKCNNRNCACFIENHYSTEIFCRLTQSESDGYFIPIAIDKKWYYLKYYKGVNYNVVQMALATSKKINGGYDADFIICSFPYHPIYTDNEKKFYESYKALVRKACRVSAGKLK